MQNASADHHVPQPNAGRSLPAGRGLPQRCIILTLAPPFSEGGTRSICFCFFLSTNLGWFSFKVSGVVCRFMQILCKFHRSLDDSILMKFVFFNLELIYLTNFEIDLKIDGTGVASHNALPCVIARRGPISFHFRWLLIGCTTIRQAIFSRPPSSVTQYAQLFACKFPLHSEF